MFEWVGGGWGWGSGKVGGDVGGFLGRSRVRLIL